MIFEIGDIFKIDDTVDFDSGCYILYRDDNGTSAKKEGSQQLGYIGYSENWKQHLFKLDDWIFYVTSDNDSTPTGIKVTGGTGTKTDPYAFEPVFPDATRTPGDVDGNGKVEISDLTTLQKHLAGWSVTLK